MKPSDEYGDDVVKFMPKISQQSRNLNISRDSDVSKEGGIGNYLHSKHAKKQEKLTKMADEHI
jgi:hypothetical protein